MCQGSWISSKEPPWEALFESQWVVVISPLLCVWLLGQGSEGSREDSSPKKKYLALTDMKVGLTYQEDNLFQGGNRCQIMALYRHR